MPFLDHLEELRSRILRGLAALAVGIAAGWWLVQRFQLVVYPRPGVEPPLNVHLSEHFGYRNAKRLATSILPEEDLELYAESGTAIREGVRAGRDMSDAVPPAVWQYIREHKLYLE